MTSGLTVRAMIFTVMPRRPDREPELAELTIADPPERWRALGFEVDHEEGHLDLGGVRIWLGSRNGARGITSWAMRYIDEVPSIDGLDTPEPLMRHPPPFATHPNGATGLDHLVVATPNFDRTSAALRAVGIALKRTVENEGTRQGFVRLGPAILELVSPPSLEDHGPRFWGLTIVVISLEELADRLGPHLREIRPAVQPQRRIATLAASAGLSTQVAFMSPEPP